MSGLMFVMVAPASAAPARLVATKAEGVTIEKVKAATAPIDVAQFEAGGKHYNVKCAGASGELACEIWGVEVNKLFVASADLKVCKDGNDFAIIGEKEGIAGKMVIIPSGMFVGDPSKRAVCGG